MNYIIIGCGRIFEYYKSNILPILASSWVLVALVENDISKVHNLKKEFNYKPKTSVTEGVSNFVKWYKNYYKI